MGLGGGEEWAGISGGETGPIMFSLWQGHIKDGGASPETLMLSDAISTELQPQPGFIRLTLAGCTNAHMYTHTHTHTHKYTLF